MVNVATICLTVGVPSIGACVCISCGVGICTCYKQALFTNAIAAIVDGAAIPEDIQYFQDYTLANASARLKVARKIERLSQDPDLSEGRQRLMNQMAVVHNALHQARANHPSPILANMMERDIEVSSTASSSVPEARRRWMTSASATSAARARVSGAATETTSSTGSETQRERTPRSTGRSRVIGRYEGSSSASPARSAATPPRGRAQRLGEIAEESKSPSAEHKAEASPSALALVVLTAMAGGLASRSRGEANIHRGGANTILTPTATTPRSARSTPRTTEIGMRTGGSLLTTPMRVAAATTNSPSRLSGSNAPLGNPTPDASRDCSRRPPPQGP
jgi:hypothetical protein